MVGEITDPTSFRKVKFEAATSYNESQTTKVKSSDSSVVIAVVKVHCGKTKAKKVDEKVLPVAAQLPEELWSRDDAAELIIKNQTRLKHISDRTEEKEERLRLIANNNDFLKVKEKELLGNLLVRHSGSIAFQDEERGMLSSDTIQPARIIVV